jgi:hypothetical protein
MNDAATVGGGQAFGDLHAVIDGPWPGEGTPEKLAQRLPLQQFEDHEGDA